MNGLRRGSSTAANRPKFPRNKTSKCASSRRPCLRGVAKFGTFLKDSIAVLIWAATERPIEAARDRAPQGGLENKDFLGRGALRRSGAYRVRHGLHRAKGLR